jgi:hypothetical protein
MNSMSRFSSESLNYSPQSHQSTLRNSLPLDAAPPIPWMKPQSRQREGMSLLRTTDTHALSLFRKTTTLHCLKCGRKPAA